MVGVVIRCAIAGLFLFPSASLIAAEPVKTVIIGSCIKQAQPMPLLRAMAEAKPDLTLLLGDNIYADTSDMSVMRTKYATLGANQDFQALRNAAPLLAVWDDHDYGVNDGGSDYPQREAAQQVFLDFWQVSEKSPRRERKGVYHAEVFGPPGQRVQVILLDARYHRSPLKTGERRVGGPYYPDDDPGKTMLGEEQWTWLEQQLSQPADLRLIGSGIQIIAEAAGQETWSNLPIERKRLFDLIRKTKANGVILLSGDRHWSELSVEKDLGPYPVYELTSSSINQKHPRGTPTDNRYRDLPTTWHEENYGKILIDWEGRQVELQIVTAQGQVPIKKTISFDELQTSRD